MKNEAIFHRRGGWLHRQQPRTRRLVDEADATVTVFDNFSSGREWHLGEPLLGGNARRVATVRGDVKDRPALTEAMRGHDHVYHFASNPDIARAAREPDVDFWEGTYLTQNVLEAMRVSGVRRLTYASGSGVYGDTGHTPVYEDFSPLLPVSTYGASKLAGEALICAYRHMFDLSAVAFRFANVVGPNQTHGVAYDFVRRLRGSVVPADLGRRPAEQVLHPRRRRDRRHAAGGSGRLCRVLITSTSPPKITSP